MIASIDEKAAPNDVASFTLPPYRSLTIYTSNVMRAGVFTGLAGTSLKKSNLELIQAIKDTIQTTLTSTPSLLHYDHTTGELEISDLRHHVAVLADDRADLEITAKLFFLPSNESTPYPPSYIKDSLTRLTQLLGVTTLDTVILSFYGLTFESEDDPDVSAPDEDVIILPAWRELEQAQKEGKVARIGVSDFSRARLEALAGWAEVQPSVDQVSLRDCCVTPKDLITFAKERGVELLTHGDEADLLPEDEWIKILEQFGMAKKGRPKWVLKYSSFVKARGIVADKGYIVFVQ